MHAVVELVKGRMRQPGLVEMQGIDLAVEFFLDRIDIVENAVVGALGNRQNTRFGFRFGCEGIGADFFLDVFPGEFFERDRADDAKVVARRHQEHRHRAGHGDRVQDRHMAVAVDDHHIARGHRRMPHHLVRGRGAIGDEKQVVAVENARGIALRGRHRS
jgi:hypothetical protein